jgi:hypothetical protein
MRLHVHNTVSKCFAMLRQRRSIHQSVPASAYQTLLVSLVLTKLDYGNAVLSGLSVYLIRRLQSVMNAAARSIAGLRRSEHITTTLAGLHWLQASERIDFKLATLTFRCLHGAAPSYLSCDPRRLADIPSRRCLRSSASNALYVQQPGCRRLVTECSLSLPLVSVTIFLPLSHLRRLFLSSVGF